MGEFVTQNENGSNRAKSTERLRQEYERVKELIESGSDSPANRSHLELIADKLAFDVASPPKETSVTSSKEQSSAAYSNLREDFIRQRHLIREKYADLRQKAEEQFLDSQIPRVTFYNLIGQYNKRERDELHRLNRSA